jgi:hypothetical protein
MGTAKTEGTEYMEFEAIQQPRYTLNEYGKLENVGGNGDYSSISTITDIRDKVIKASLIKYD